jgi:hypothetical protein
MRVAAHRGVLRGGTRARIAAKPPPGKRVGDALSLFRGGTRISFVESHRLAIGWLSSFIRSFQ